MLYVEGPRDREILESWARRVDPALARCIELNTVILGGRRPARAIADFRKRGGVSAGYSGLVVLDRDDEPQAEFRTLPPGESAREPDSLEESASSTSSGADSALQESGLEVFVWSLRHIESYLLVPAAIRRLLGLPWDDRSVERFIALGAGAQAAGSATDAASPGSGGSVHAKRTLGAGGSLSEALGAPLRAGDIARAMRLEDLHGDIRELFERIGVLSGSFAKGPEVVVRNRQEPIRGS